MSLKHLSLSAAIAVATLAVPNSGHAGNNEFIGNISLLPYNFCPRGSVEADGRLLPIASNNALFALYGTTYGGDGRTTFGLPDMRGRIPVHTGTGPGLTTRSQGTRGGAERVTLAETNLPSHAHQMGIRTVNSPPNSPTPFASAFTTNGGNAFVDGEDPGTPGSTAKSPRFMNPNTMFVDNAGANQPVDIVPPYQAIRFCVTTVGIFPSRN